MKLNIVLVVSYCMGLCLATSIGFAGEFIHVPVGNGESDGKNVLNGVNYQSRFDVSLTSLSQSHGFKTHRSVVNKKYRFAFDELTSGEYELVVNSYDFMLNNQRFRVLVNDTDAAIKVYEDDLASKTYNASSAQTVSYLHPLKIEVNGFKEYYEKQSGSLFDILLNSPFGFIFKNRTYTIMFVVAVAVMVTPYLLQFINPDFAEEFNQIKQEVDQSKQTQASTPKAQLPVRGNGNPPSRGSGNGLRQRK